MFMMTLSPSTPLPVQLISFNGTLKDCKSSLIWQSGVEDLFSGYEIQHSQDGTDFNSIGFVAAKGSNSAYTFSHSSVSEGTNYYRLKLIDDDGRAEL